MTNEQQAIEEEHSYRRGYLDGWHAALNCWEQASRKIYDHRHIGDWVESQLYYWTHHNLIEIVPPPLPPRWSDLRDVVFDVKGTLCAYCGNRATVVDHVHAVALGGSWELSNLVPCCRQCNARKKDKPYSEWVNMLAYATEYKMDWISEARQWTWKLV